MRELLNSERGMLLTVAAFQQSENGGLSLFPRLLPPPQLPEGNVSVCLSLYHYKRKVCVSVCARARVCGRSAAVNS